MITLVKKLILSLAVAFGASLLMPASALAVHSWNNFHWARTASPFTLKAGDNVSSVWDSYLRTAASDWGQSEVLNMTVIKGKTFPFLCRPSTGQIEICNYRYGRNGWLGVAQVWVNGEHITKGVVKLNDTYYSTAAYNKPAWRAIVTCQEIGHTLGLGHVDEDFDNPPMGTCMDYSADPSLNRHPNQHDYDELALIYSHLDTTTSVSQAKAAGTAAEVPRGWGKLVKKHGRLAIYRHVLPASQAVYTYVMGAGTSH